MTRLAAPSGFAAGVFLLAASVAGFVEHAFAGLGVMGR